jgi:hypothetical protein
VFCRHGGIMVRFECDVHFVFILVVTMVINFSAYRLLHCA